jgi:hypothetical protein
VHFYNAINKRQAFYAAALVVGAILFLCVKELFFFDEDVFVTDTGSIFFQQTWQRSPIPKLFFKIENFFFGKAALGYHVTSIFLHLINGFVALKVTKKIIVLVSKQTINLQTEIILPVFFIIFLLSPVHSEPLCYVLAQGILPTTFFCLLTILFFLKTLDKNKNYSILSLLFFILSILSYEISWLLPCIIFCLAFFINDIKKHSFNKSLLASVPYFLVLAIWFFIKTVFISKSLVIDYSGFSVLNINPVTFCRNTMVMLLRNFIPPFKSTAVFVFTGTAFTIFILVALIKVYKTNKAVLKLLILFLLLTILAFLPAAPFGIDSHDSESERYIYFSSVFAISFLTVLLTASLKNKLFMSVIIVMLLAVYNFILFNTINYYKQGGIFSKKYLTTLFDSTKEYKNVFILNQPSQYKGALLFRAQSRLPETGENLTTLNEYMHYLYNQDQKVYTTLSLKNLDTIPKEIKIISASLDSSAIYFPGIQYNNIKGTISANNIPAFPFDRKNSCVFGLSNDSLFIFK